MEILFTYPTGKRQEGLVLSANQNRMRIVIRHRNETLELRLVEGQWLSEDGDPIEFDAMLTDGRDEIVRELSVPAAVRMRAAAR